MIRWKEIWALAISGVFILGSSSYAQTYSNMSQRCFTPQFWCMMPAPAPVGSSCYCQSPYGAVYGIVR